MSEVIISFLGSFMNICLSLVIPGGILAILGLFGLEVMKYVKTLQICGDPNQWVVLMNNGKMKQAAIGLSTWASPGDTVAIFPSKVNKINFSARQVTSEMSGLEVSAMICWVVNRQGDGPMKAYVSLGKDLEKTDPQSTNDLIAKMASAVIRNQISNADTNDILKSRDMMREAIKSEISKVTEGWGVWLETIEITDVKILSKKLFDDLQVTFLEDNQKKATLLKLEVDNELEMARLGHQLVSDKRKKDTELEKLKRSQNNEFKEQQQIVTKSKLNFKLRKEEIRADSTKTIYLKNNEVKAVLKGYEIATNQKQNQVANELNSMKQNQENLKQELLFQKQAKQQQIALSDQEMANLLLKQKDQYAFQKEQLKQPGHLDRVRQQVIQNVYKELRVSQGIQVNLTGKDPFVNAIDRFQQSALQGYKK